MQKHPVKTFLSASCITFIALSSSSMANLFNDSHNYTPSKHHRRLQAESDWSTIIQASKLQNQRKIELVELLDTAQTYNSQGRFAAARQKANELAQLERVTEAKKILDTQEEHFYMQQILLLFKSHNTPSTQTIFESPDIEDRPTVGTRYEFKAKKPFVGVLKKGNFTPEVKAKLGFLMGLHYEDLLKEKSSKKRTRIEEIRELEAKTLKSYTEASIDPKALNNIALIMHKQGKINEAENFFQLAAKKRQTLALNNLGEFLEAQKRHEEAKNAYTVSAEKGCIEAQYNLAMMHMSYGEYKEAEKWLNRLNKNNKLMTTKRDGNIYQELQDYQGDMTHNQRSIMFSYVTYNLAALEIRKNGLTLKAEKLLLDVIESKTDLSGKAHYKFFQLLKKTNPTAAYTHLKKAAIENLPHAQLDYGRILMQKGKTKQAMLQFQRAAKKGDFRAAGEMVSSLKKVKQSISAITA